MILSGRRIENYDGNDWNKRYGGTDENLAACLNFMFTWRGIPVVYYGTETPENLERLANGQAEGARLVRVA